MRISKRIPDIVKNPETVKGNKLKIVLNNCNNIINGYKKFNKGKDKTYKNAESLINLINKEFERRSHVNKFC